MRRSAPVLFSRLAGKARLKHLQLLAAIGELGSLQKAAAHVGLSQPAATHALSELEALVDAPLFERHAKGMRPSPLGAAMLPLLRDALRSLQQCAEVAAAMTAGTSSTLRVGAIGAALSGLLSATLPRFSAARPEVLVDVVQLGPNDLLRAVSQDTLDVALCRRPAVMPEGMKFIDLLSDRYAVICGAQHPLAGKRVPKIDALAREIWLMPPQSTIAGSEFTRLWEGSAHPPPVCWVTTRSPVLLWSMLSQRDLLVLIPFNLARPYLEAGMFREIQGPWSMQLEPLGALMRAHASTAETVSAFIEQLALDGDQSGE